MDSIERVAFERRFLDIGIEAAGTTGTDFIAAHNVGHQDYIVDSMTHVDVLITLSDSWPCLGLPQRLE